MQVLRNVVFTRVPCRLGRFASLREASLRLLLAPMEACQALAQLPTSLEALTITVYDAVFPVRVCMSKRSCKRPACMLACK